MPTFDGMLWPGPAAARRSTRAIDNSGLAQAFQPTTATTKRTHSHRPLRDNDPAGRVWKNRRADTRPAAIKSRARSKGGMKGPVDFLACRQLSHPRRGKTHTSLPPYLTTTRTAAFYRETQPANGQADRGEPLSGNKFVTSIMLGDPPSSPGRPGEIFRLKLLLRTNTTRASLG